MIKGSCLCGTVRFEVSGPLSDFVFDHCSRCRKATGSAFSPEIMCAAADFRWVSGESLVKTYVAPVRERPPGYRRDFCAICGSMAPSVLGARVCLPAGALDDDPGIRPARHIFVGYKAPWFEIADAAPQFHRHPV
jgi:hypothetical protein